MSASYISDEGPHKCKIKRGKALRSNVIARRRTKQESRPKKRGGGKNCKDRKKNPVRSTHNIIITSGIPLCIYIIITNDARDIIERERDYIQGHLNRRKVHFTILVFFVFSFLLKLVLDISHQLTSGKGFQTMFVVVS